MGEPGVSRVVSVKVNERAAPRTQSLSARPPRNTVGDALRDTVLESEDTEVEEATQVA
jgi:hypothetical protein